MSAPVHSRSVVRKKNQEKEGRERKMEDGGGICTFNGEGCTRRRGKE